MATREFDFLVLGGGSGGLAAAQRAAEHGANTALIEAERLGGTCVNRGCVPKKIMVNAARINNAFTLAKDYGFSFSSAPGFDYGHLRKAREEYIQRLNSVYARNLKKRNIELIRGWGRFLDANTIEANSEVYRAKHILIATGGRPRKLPVGNAHLAGTSDDFFRLAQWPTRVAVIGGGYIATELACVFNALDVNTSLIVRAPAPLNHFDSLIQSLLSEILPKRGIRLLVNTELDGLKKKDGDLWSIDKTGREHGPFDLVLGAIGRIPNTDQINLTATGVKTDKSGAVLTDPWQTTSIPHVYAIGDVTGHDELTPVAIAAGRRLADRIFGKQEGRRLLYENIPTVVFSEPPVGTVGLTKHQALEQYGPDDVRVYDARFTPMLYGLSAESEKVPAAIRLVTHGDEERIVGVHLVGEGVDEMLQGFAVAVSMGARKADFDDTVAIHPTTAEEVVTMR